MAHTAMRKKPFGTQAVGGPLYDGRHTVAEKPFFAFRTVAVDIVSFSVLRILSVRIFYFRDGIFMHPKHQQ